MLAYFEKHVEKSRKKVRKRKYPDIRSVKKKVINEKDEVGKFTVV